ncbi:YihY/virulence factor BrkB family protein [Desulfococcaceae bacterium HSG8]|nr:YihY/virulence factor BrkB family protein [Desulfococcaceae bacterium HSG8]
MITIVSEIIAFIKTGIWRIRLKETSRVKSFFIRLLRILLLVIRGFHENKCGLRASSLTFYTALSIVPMVAMAFGISTGFGYEKAMEKYLMGNFPGQETVVIRIIDMARSLLENTQGGMIAGIGSLVLMWTVIKVLMNVEYSLNAIWEVEKSRPFGRKFSDYLSLMFICPLLVIVSSSLTVFITSEVRLIEEKISLMKLVSPLIFSSFKLLPYCLIWALFTIIYLLMPNTKVNFISGFTAGLIAGTIYQLAQGVYISFQVGVASYNAIYGSFAALPLFLIWLKLSWLIVLFGAEISFAHQNADAYEFEPDCRRISFLSRKLYALRVVSSVTKNFSRGKNPLTAEQISLDSEIPVRLVRQLLCELVEIGILSHIYIGEGMEPAYQPARSADMLTITYITDALEQRGMSHIPGTQTEEMRILSEILQEFRETAEKSSSNKRLGEIQNVKGEA